MAFKYDIKLGNILAPGDDETIEGQLAVGTKDDEALCLKVLTTKLTSNPKGLYIRVNLPVKASVIPFLVSKVDDQEYEATFTYTSNSWKVNNNTVNLLDYGVLVDGAYVNGDAFKVKYSFRTITKVVSADSTGKIRDISKRLVEVPSTEFEATGPLTCEKGEDFNLYTKSKVPFSIECTAKITNTLVSSDIMTRRIDANNYWTLKSTLGWLSFTNCSGGITKTSTWLFKRLRKDSYSHIKFYTTDTVGCKFKVEIDGVPSLFPGQIDNQLISNRKCELIAGSKDVKFMDNIIISGVRYGSSGKERRMTVPMTSGKSYYSKEIYED